MLYHGQTVIATFIKLSEKTNDGTGSCNEFARWQHPAMRRDTFSAPRTIWLHKCHATLPVIEYFVSHSRSLKIIDDGTIRKIGYGFQFAFHSNYSRFDTIHERDRQTLSRRHRSRLCISSRGNTETRSRRKSSATYNCYKK